MKPLKTLYPPTPPPLQRGARVRVTEQNIRPWNGIVGSMKHSPVSGWWAEITGPDGGTWSIPIDAGFSDVTIIEGDDHE